MKYLILSGVILLSGWLHAQEHTCQLEFSGHIFDDHDETPLAFSHVTLTEIDRTAIADENAFFKMEGVCPGRYTVEIRHVGCEPLIENVTLTTKNSSNLVFRMEHHHELREVEVAAQSQELKEHVNNETIKDSRLNTNRMESLSQAIAEVRGVDVLKSGPNISKPIIQGVFGNRIAIYNQQTRLEDQQWGADHAPAMELSEAGSISVVKGAQGVEYGPEAMGGAIIMQPAPFEDQRALSGQIQAGAFSNGRGIFSNTRISGALLKNKRLSYRFSGGYNQSGNRHTPDYVLNNTGNQNIAFSGALQYRYKTLRVALNHSQSQQQYGILSDAHNSSLSDLAAAIERENPATSSDFTYAIENPRQKVNHQTTQLSISLKPGNFSQVEFNYAYQQNLREEYDLRRGRYNDIPAVDLRLRAHNATFKYTRVLDRNLSFKSGIDGRWITNLSNPETGTRPIVPNFQQKQIGGFALLKWNPENWEINVGLRYDFQEMAAFKWYKTSVWEQQYASEYNHFVADYNESGTQVFTEPLFNFHNFSGALGANYHWSPKLSTGIRGALAVRPPNAPEMFSDGVHLGSATVEYGNLSLRTENAISGEVFTAYESDRIELNGAAFVQYFNGFILPEISGVELTIRGSFPQMAYAQTNALFYGTNWQAHFELSPEFILRHQGAIVFALDMTRRSYLPNIPPPQMRNEIVWRPETETGKSQFEMALGVQSHLKQNRAPKVVPISELQSLSDSQIEEIRSEGAFDITPPPGEYHLVHGRVQLTIPWKTRELEIALMADNLLNRRYRDYLNRFRNFSLDTGINIRLMLNLKF